MELVKAPMQTRLPLSPIKDEAGNYLFKGATPALVESVSYVENDVTKGEFEGLKVGHIEFMFVNHPFADRTKKEFKHVETIVYSRKDNGTTDRDKSKVDKNILDLWERIRQILTVFTECTGKKSLNNMKTEDFTKFVSPITVEDTPEVRTANWNAFCKYIVEYINGTDIQTNMFMHEANKPAEVWLKLEPKWDTGIHYTLPTFATPKDWIIESLKSDDKLKKIINPIRIDFKGLSLDLRSKSTGTKSRADAPSDGPMSIGTGGLASMLS